MKANRSYSQIIKSSSIVGGAAGITFLLLMIRTKFFAVLVGAGGVGLMSGLTAIQNFVGTVAGLGIQSSAVREIAAAVSNGQEQAIGCAVLTTRRICWLTGLVGMLTIVAFSPLLSRLTFESDAYTIDIAALGIVILLVNLAGGQLALLQGMRRISEMANANISAAALGTIIAIGCYYLLGLRGIVPSLIAIATLQLAFAWRFARRVPVPMITLTWMQTFRKARTLVTLGFVFMWSALMVSIVSYFTIFLISRQMGLEAVGLYSAAFLLSGVSVNFVLGAMGADYYPRLVGVAHDKDAVNRLVNEQTEVGLLLALPGLMATLTLAPWILHIFYAREFVAATELLHWFVLGCLGRVISWPLGFLMLALGRGRWFLLTETSANLVHIIFIAIGLKLFGIEGVAIAFFMMYVCYIAAVYLVCGHLTEFSWSANSRRIALYTLPASAIVFLVCQNLSVWLATMISVPITLTLGLFCLRELILLVEPEHRVVRVISQLPGARLFLTSKGDN